MLLNDDKPETLSDVVIYGKIRPVNWEIDKSQSKMYQKFPEKLADIMGT
jgi:hypothetical protein